MQHYCRCSIFNAKRLSRPIAPARGTHKQRPRENQHKVQQRQTQQLAGERVPSIEGRGIKSSEHQHIARPALQSASHPTNFSKVRKSTMATASFSTLSPNTICVVVEVWATDSGV